MNEFILKDTKPKIICFNQSVGPLFLELMEDLAAALECVQLVTGSVLLKTIANLKVRQLASYNRGNFWSRLWSWAKFSVDAVGVMWSASSEDSLLLVVSNPPILVWFAGIVNLLRHKRYIVLVYDIYPDILVGLGRLSSSHPVVGLWRWVNCFSLSRAERIITIGAHMARTLEVYIPPHCRAKKIIVIPTWVDAQRFLPIPKSQNPFVTLHKLERAFIVLYSGNIGFSHEIGILLEAARRLRDDSTFHFLIIGEGSGKAELVAQASAERLSNVTFLPLQSESILPYSLAAADVAAVSIGRGAEGKMMPSKTYYAMATGSALLGLSHPPNDLSEAIEMYQCGVNVRLDDSDGIEAALRRFRCDVSFLRTCQVNARVAAERAFDRFINTRQIVLLIKQLCDLPSA